MDKAYNIYEAIRRSQELAIENHIKANTIVISKGFAKKDRTFLKLTENQVVELPPMIMGLEVEMQSGLPDGVAFAVLEQPTTKREEYESRIRKQTATEIITLIKHYRQTAESCPLVVIYEIITEIMKKYGSEFVEEGEE